MENYYFKKKTKFYVYTLNVLMRSSCELSQKNVAKSLALFTQSIHFYPALVRSLSDGFFCLLICRVASDGALNFLNYSRKAFAIPFSLPPLSTVIETNFRI